MNRQLAASVRYHAASVAENRGDYRNASRWMLAGWHFDDKARQDIRRAENAALIRAAVKFVVLSALAILAYVVVRHFFLSIFA